MGSPKAKRRSSKSRAQYLGNQESATIKLDERNFARGYLEDGKSILLLFDSGATKTIMSKSCVLNSKHLSSKKITRVEPVQFRLGNGQCISADAQVEFVVTIQGHKFQVNALIAPDLIGIDVILGSQTLKELQGALDFSTNCFSIRSKKTYARPVHRLTLRPGQTKYVNLRVRTPPFARNAEVVAYPTNFVSSMCPSAMLVKVRNGRTRILLNNNTSKPFTVTNYQTLAYVNWADIVTVTQELPSESMDQVMSHGYHDNSRCAQLHNQIPVSGETQMGSQLNHSQSEIDRDALRRYNLERYPHLDSNDPTVEMTSEELVRRDIDLDNSILNDSEKRKVLDMIVDYRDAFSLYGELSSCPDFEADITLTNDEPFFIRPYRLSEDDKHIVSRELDKLVRLGILAVGHQSYTSPVFLIPKKGTQDKRVVTDFRYLNDRIKRINHPFPLLDETLCTIGNSGAQVLSVLDLKSAFFCLPLSPKAQQYTGIASYYGGKHYYYKRLPQGLNLSPAIFQAKIDEVLSTIPNSEKFCIAHHDDIIVYSADKQSHQQHLEVIFETLVEHGLKISPKKCALFRNSVVYMGHLVSINAEGQACVQPLQGRCRAISNTPVPHSLQAVRRFVGAVNYVSQFFPRLQEILKPLHALSRKHKGFWWTTEHQQAFDKVRELMCKPPVLHMPQKNGRFRLYSDTSRVATGSYVTQVVNGNEHLLGYYSKVLPEACLRYSVTELELFGLLINVSAFKHLLRGVEFDAFVDHSAIKDILTSKNEPPTARVRRMLFKLSEYTFKIGYKKGSELVLADYLSRAPQEGDSEIDRVIPLAFSAVSSPSEVELTEVIVEQPPSSTNMANPVLTRAMAKEKGITVPDIYPSEEVPDSPEAPASPRAVPIPSAPPDLSTPHILSPPLRGSGIREKDGDARPPQSRLGSPIPCPGLQRPNPVRVRSEAELETPEVPPSSSNRVRSSSTQGPVPPEPRLVDKVNFDRNEVIRDPPSELIKPSTPLVPKIGDIKANHIPKQKELQRVMKNIQKKIIRDYNLPFDMHELQVQQETCPSFKPVYDFLAHDILPSDIKSARTVTAKAEQFILCNGLLFRLFLHEKYDAKMTLQLVIPDTMVDRVITKYHDSLLSNHQGVMRTYLTIRQYFFMRNMFQRINNYIKACLRCQEFKGKPDKLRPFHSRVPDAYRPFDRISLDFKSMPVSVSGYKHIMVACDEITRFVVCVPLKTLDAETVCEAILQKIVAVFGPPSQLVTDAASALTSKIAELLCKTLGIEQKSVSVCNHGSLQVERQIQTLSNFLKVNLNQFGMDWVRYVPTTAYAYNAFSSSYLGDHSPFELAFGRKPPNLTGLVFNPMSGLTQSHGEYAASLKKRFDHLSHVMLNLQRHHQNAQQVKISNKLSKSPIYSEGQLVYLYKPTSSSLTANSRKIAAEWCGPLVIHQVLDRTHYLLTTLKGEILRDVFNFNRLKPCFIRSSSDAPHVTDIATLRRMLESSEPPEDKSLGKTNGVHVMFHDETGQILPEVSSDDILCTGLTDVVESDHLPKELNRGFAALDKLSEEAVERQYRILCKAQFQGMLVKRARYKLGSLQVLTSILDEQGRQVFTFWWNVGSYANTETILDFLLENNVEITGAPQRMLLRLFA